MRAAGPATASNRRSRGGVKRPIVLEAKMLLCHTVGVFASVCALESAHVNSHGVLFFVNGLTPLTRIPLRANPIQSKHKWHLGRTKPRLRHLDDRLTQKETLGGTTPTGLSSLKNAATSASGTTP